MRFPRTHIRDFHITPKFDERYVDATLEINAEVKGALDKDIKVSLYGPDKAHLIIEGSIAPRSGQKKCSTSLAIKHPLKWTAEEPNLYHLVLIYGKQVIAQRVGFREVKLKDGLILVNGKRVVFRGVNRHEHHPTFGRAVPRDFLLRDLLLMKRHNINAIRTCHQPSDTHLYDLADELGFWIMDEADLECHGFDTVHERSLPLAEQSMTFEQKKALTYGRAGKWLSDNKDWEHAYVDRATQMVHRDKNHPSIVIWSLGNEAFYGRNFQSMYDWIKAYDNSRPIHYEGDVLAQTTDMFSLMYPELDTIERFALEWKGDKPLVLCEYIHAMGNGPGNIREYIELFYKHPCLQGGWVWEWANHGLLTKNAVGEEFYAYGGDFGEFPHDGNFVMDGLVDSEHKIGPGLVEYKKALEPVQLLRYTPEAATIINRYDMIPLDHLACTCVAVTDGVRNTASAILVPETLPGQTSDLALPEIQHDDSGDEVFLELSFTLKASTAWAAAGHEVAWLQIPVKRWTAKSRETCVSDGVVNVAKTSPSRLSLTSQKCSWQFDLLRGKLTSWTKDSQPILFAGPELSFYRAPTDNDEDDARDWHSKLVNHLRPHTRSVTWNDQCSDGSVQISCVQRIAPPSLEWSIDAIFTYRFYPERVVLQVKGTTQGANQPRTLPRIGLQLSLDPGFDTATWYGRGPGESYKDKKLSQKFGIYNSQIQNMNFEYEFPQESGNRTETRWVEFTNGNGDGAAAIKAEFLNKADGFDFQASHFDVRDVEKAKHPFELKKSERKEVIVRLDMDHHGLGSGSCGKCLTMHRFDIATLTDLGLLGPNTLPQYSLLSKDFEFAVQLT